MTSVATICGHFPLTLVTGPGAAARNSIGLVLVAGMFIGTAFTLFFVPAIYLLIARDHRAHRDASAELGEPGLSMPPPGEALEPVLSLQRRGSEAGRNLALEPHEGTS